MDKIITQENITLAERLDSPTPKLFKKIRIIGITLGVVGAVLVATPVLPIVATIGGIMVSAGTVATAVSSAAVDFNKLDKIQGVEP